MNPLIPQVLDGGCAADHELPHYALTRPRTQRPLRLAALDPDRHRDELRVIGLEVLEEDAEGLGRTAYALGPQDSLTL
jgi:hypothetical protein